MRGTDRAPFGLAARGPCRVRRRAAVRDERDAAEFGQQISRVSSSVVFVDLTQRCGRYPCARKGSLDPSVSQRSGSGFRPIRERTFI
jgi:hypothetical protein